MADSELEHKARKLRELFGGRFNQTDAESLITELGGIEQAVDFVLNEDAEQVRGFLKKDPAYLKSLRADSQYTASLLTNGVNESVRQFACKDCERSWWRKVPARKEVSVCRRCKVKYDPIPKDKEWGWGIFKCTCDNEFSGYGVMGLTSSECYKCGIQVPVDHINPPRRQKRPRKTNAPHECNGVNCYAHEQDQQMAYNMSDISHGISNVSLNSHNSTQQFGRRRDQNLTSQNDYNSDDGQASAGAYTGPAPQPVCIHPKSQRNGRGKPRTYSTKHVSTGSTVTTFMTQASVDSRTISIAKTMDTISEY